MKELDFRSSWKQQGHPTNPTKTKNPNNQELWDPWVDNEYTQKADNFVIDDDDMDSDTATESNFFAKVTVILAQSEWSIAKDVRTI